MPKLPYFDLVLGLAALVEGLALAKIADVGVEALTMCGSERSFALLQLTLCFVVVVRLYQGFISISIRPIEVRDLQFQMIAVLMIGVLQTVMIAVVRKSDQVQIFYVCALIISVLGATLHWSNQFRLIQHRIDYSVEAYHYESDFQFVSSILLTVAAVFIFIACLRAEPFFRVAAVVVPICLLVFNSWLSYQLFSYNSGDTGNHDLPSSARAMEAIRRAMTRVGLRRPADSAR